MIAFTDRNTASSIRQDLKTLSDLSSYLEYGDTGTALRIIDEWSNTLSDDLITLEDQLKLFEENPSRYYMDKMDNILSQIINDKP